MTTICTFWLVVNNFDNKKCVYRQITEHSRYTKIFEKYYEQF